MALATKAADGRMTAPYNAYACPSCAARLRLKTRALHCDDCSQTYPVEDGLPKFISEDLSQSEDPVFRRMTAIDRMSRVYETRLWYPIVLAIYGGFRKTSLPQLIAAVCQDIGSDVGRVLDVACGPGTYGRRIASQSKEVFGIDISKRMLRQGMAYSVRDGIANMHFARARVESLPFRREFFDAVVCCGSLHLFADTVIALREVARVTKPGGTLSGFTFMAGDAGILKYRRVREWSFRRHGLHVFEIPEMEQYLDTAGFERFRPEVFGSVLLFRARRKSA